MKQQGGFTLIEAVVALGIFALLALAGIVVLRQSLDAQAATDHHLQQLAQLQHTDALLRSDLSQAALRPVRHADGRPGLDAISLATDGDARAWRGHAPLLSLTRRGWSNPAGQQRPSLQHVQYRLVDGRLERSSRQHPDSADVAQTQVLLEGISALELTSFHTGRWDRGWPGGQAVLPQAIRLRYQLDGIGAVEHVLALSGEGQ